MTNWRPNLYDELTVIAMAGYFNSSFGIKMGNSCIYMQDYLVPLGGLPGYLSWYKLCSSFSQETFTDIVDNWVVKCCSQFQNNTYSSVTLSLLYLGEVCLLHSDCYSHVMASLRSITWTPRWSLMLTSVAYSSTFHTKDHKATFSSGQRQMIKQWTLKHWAGSCVPLVNHLISKILKLGNFLSWIYDLLVNKLDGYFFPCVVFVPRISCSGNIYCWQLWASRWQSSQWKEVYSKGERGQNKEKKKKATDKATKPLFFTFTIVMFMWLQIFDQESPPILCCGVKAAFSSFMILSDLMLDLPFMLWYV